ncbi:MAG: hypothetical protein ACK54E_07160 [Pseudanabaena sp.]|jgi:hypothetical protein
MSQFKFFKNREYSFFSLWNWMLLFSLGLHIALLLLPNTLKQKTETTSTANISELEKIRIIQLPTTSTIDSPKSSLSSNSQAPPLIDKTSETDAKLALKNPANDSAILPNQETQGESPLPNPSPKSNLTTQSNADNQNIATKASSQDTFPDFPKYPNATTGSFGLFQGQEDLASQQTPDRQDIVATYFEKELQASGYEVKTISSEPTRKVYQIFKGGLTKFLNLIVRDGQGTAIALSSKPLDIKSLQTEVATKAEIDFDIVLKQLTELGAQRIAIPEFYFVQPEKFYAESTKERNSYDIDKPKFGFDGNFIVILDKKPEQVFSSFFAPNFQNSKFEVSQMSNYGGGMVYKVKQSSFVRYLNLLPTQSGVGTIVVVWKSLPK